nr:MAG TPA: hypothetical protein [Bacteriophage sp.]
MSRTGEDKLTRRKCGGEAPSPHFLLSGRYILS